MLDTDVRPAARQGNRVIAVLARVSEDIGPASPLAAQAQEKPWADNADTNKWTQQVDE